MTDCSRQEWMAILARADESELVDASQGLLPTYVVLRSPEIGLIMLRGRIGGNGQPFNVGETTVARCVVRSQAGYIGHAYALGRELQKVEVAAAIDAGLQDDGQFDMLYKIVVSPLARRQEERRARLARQAAATQVQFYTMSTMRT